MWPVALIIFLLYFISGILSNVANIIKFFEDKNGDEDEPEEENKKHKLEE